LRYQTDFLRVFWSWTACRVLTAWWGFGRLPARTTLNAGGRALEHFQPDWAGQTEMLYLLV
jgi:hypothetical protein